MCSNWHVILSGGGEGEGDASPPSHLSALFCWLWQTRSAWDFTIYTIFVSCPSLDPIHMICLNIWLQTAHISVSAIFFHISQQYLSAFFHSYTVNVSAFFTHIVIAAHSAHPSSAFLSVWTKYSTRVCICFFLLPCVSWAGENCSDLHFLILYSTHGLELATQRIWPLLFSWHFYSITCEPSGTKIFYVWHYGTAC